MQVSWNQNVTSLLFQNTSIGNNSDNGKNNAASSTSSTSATDSVQISRRAINALMKAEKREQRERSLSQDNASPVKSTDGLTETL